MKYFVFSPAEERELKNMLLQYGLTTHIKLMQLTYRESKNSTEKSKNPERRRKRRHQIKYATDKTT